MVLSNPKRSTFSHRIFMRRGDYTQSIILQQCHLQCLDSFHNGQPVWAFTSSQWVNEQPLHLTTTMETFADIWGPLWKGKDPEDPTLNLFSSYVVGGGVIVPWQPDEPCQLLDAGEVLCHWSSHDDQANNPEGISILNFLSPFFIRLSNSVALQIGETSNRSFR